MAVLERVPDVVFKTRVRDESIQPNPYRWEDKTTQDIFGGKKSSSILFTRCIYSYLFFQSPSPLRRIIRRIQGFRGR